MHLLCLVLGLVALSPFGRGVLISEIMHKPRWQSEWFEYVELHNEQAAPFDLSGLTLTVSATGTYTFPSGALIPPNGYIVVARDPIHLQQAYLNLQPSQVYGNLSDSIKAKGTISLSNTLTSTVYASVTYDSEPPWSPLTDGFGPSLELTCLTGASQNNRASWSPSPVPENGDPHVEWAGSPGLPPFWTGCPRASPAPPPKVIITELQYHPQQTNNFEEMHEYVEFYNNGDSVVNLTRFRFVSEGNVRFTFPSGATIAPGEYKILAKDPASFQAVYGTAPAWGPYTGELDNGGEGVALIDKRGVVVDYFFYDDEVPWPVGADGMGASENFIQESPYWVWAFANPFKSLSLQRRDYTRKATTASTWKAALPTPGASGLDPQPILPYLEESHTPNTAAINNLTAITINVELKPWPIAGQVISNVTITYWLYDAITKSNGTRITLPMTQVVANPDTFTIIIGPFASNSIIRYTFEAKFGNQTVISPRDDEPRRHYMLFSYPPMPATAGPAYHMFISRADWGSIYLDAASCRTVGCTTTTCATVNPRWFRTVPCVVAYGDVVSDCTTRLQGSRWNRVNGETIGSAYGGWGTVSPTGTSQLRAWSYNINLPAWNKINGQNRILLLKMLQGCVMYSTDLMMELGDVLGISNSRVEGYARLHMNGYYLRYMMVILDHDDVGRRQELLDTRCWHQTTELIGDYFKVQGLSGDEGPWGWGDCRVLTAPCAATNSLISRYDHTYSRNTHKDGWRNSSQVLELTTTLEAIRNNPDPAARRAAMGNLADLNHLISYHATINYAGTWDHRFHNQFMYRRREDGKWMEHFWDADFSFGERTSANPPQIYANLYAGNDTQLHYLRLSMVDAFKPELNQRYRIFINTIFTRDWIEAWRAKARAAYNMDDLQSAPGTYSQGGTVRFEDCYNFYRFDNFFAARNNFIVQQIGNLSAGTDAWALLNNLTCPDRPPAQKIYGGYQSGPYATTPFVTLLTATSVTLGWDLPYSWGLPVAVVLMKSTDNGATWTALANGPTATSFADMPVTPGSLLQYRLVATNSLGVTEGDILNVTVPLPVPSTPPSGATPMPIPSGASPPSQATTGTPTAPLPSTLLVSPQTETLVPSAVTPTPSLSSATKLGAVFLGLMLVAIVLLGATA